MPAGGKPPAGGNGAILIDLPIAVAIDQFGDLRFLRDIRAPVDDREPQRMVESGCIALPAHLFGMSWRRRACAPDLSFGHRDRVHCSIVGEYNVGRAAGGKGRWYRF